MVHSHAVIDGDNHFIIDPITRAVTNAESKKTTLMQNDHNSERFTFEIDKLVEGHDMTLCNKIEVHYANEDTTKKNKSIGVYEVQDLAVSSVNSDKLVFSWLVSENATLHAGSLRFLIVFTCTESGDVTYRWNTGVNNSISIAKGMNNGNAIEEVYPDILSQWKNELFAYAYGVKTVHVGPEEPEEYPYIWFDTSKYIGVSDKNIGVITIKDTDGVVHNLYPFTHLKATDAANVDAELKDQRITMTRLSENDAAHARFISELGEKDYQHDQHLAKLADADKKLADDIEKLDYKIDSTAESFEQALNNGVSALNQEDQRILAIANSKSSSANVSVTIPTTGWMGDGPYTNTIVVNGSLADSNICDVIVSYDPEYKENFLDCEVGVLEQKDGSMVFSVEMIPDSPFPVNVLFVYRGGGGQ